MFLLFCAIILMIFAPWQQSVTGAGYVVAYAPSERQQVLEATIDGRIFLWNELIVENTRVNKGDFIAEMRDLDPELSFRMEANVANTQNVLNSLREVEKAKELQVRAYIRVQEEIEAAQNAYVQAATEKVTAAAQKLSIAEAAVPQLRAAFERSRELQIANNISLEKLQEAERKLLESEGKVREETANLSAARAELRGKQSDREAYIHKAEADVSYYRGELDKARSEVAKAEKDLQDMESKKVSQDNRTITAPFDGYVVHINANQGTQVLKKGDPICTLVPYTKDRAVQIWLDGNDAPLVEAGRHVRLQFEGWPAIQFAGWPSVAVGTFGGTVVSVDMVDNGKGKFRCQILPDPDELVHWPEERFLRQGVRANGWILLEQVPLWFEVWRKLNGFPPTVDVDSNIYNTSYDTSGSKSSDDKSKTKLR